MKGYRHIEPARRGPGLFSWLLALVAGGWPATSAIAEPAGGDLAATGSLALAIAKSFGALILVLGLLLLLAAAIRRLGLSGHAPGDAGLIRVLDTRMIAPKKYVAIIEIADQTVAVGITEQQITLLGQLEETDSLRAARAGAKRPGDLLASRFATVLGRAMGRAEQTNTTGTSPK